jgi:hypothetical protein
MSAIVITIGRRMSPRPEIVETAETADEHFVSADGTWGSRAKPPAGRGWQVFNFSNERRTTWTRTRLIPARGRP